MIHFFSSWARKSNYNNGKLCGGQTQREECRGAVLEALKEASNYAFLL